MSYSTDVDRAIAVATTAHSGAVDKAGEPYIQHPERVANRLPTPAEKVVAWLHDVVEDTDVTIDKIRELFGNDTAESVSAITHGADESWSDYLSRVKKDPVAKAVKIADLIDNSNLGRLKQIKPNDVIRQGKYNRALMFLMDIED